MSPSRRRVIATVGAVVVAGIVLGPVGPARAQVPPPNPGDDELEAGRQDVDAAAAEIAVLQGELDAATAALDAAQDALARSLEAATAAEVSRDAARAVAAAAQQQAAAAQVGQKVADELAAQAQTVLDDFIAASYRQGSSVGSASAFAGVSDPEDVLDRAELLAALGESQRESLEALDRAQVAKANQDALARKALAEARAREAEAEAATVAARAAYAAAEQASTAASSRSDALVAARAQVQTRLDIARATLADLDGRRRTYQQWQDARAAAEARAQAEARAAAQAAAAARAAAARESGRAGSDAPVSTPPPARAPVVGPPSASGVVAPASGWLSSGFGARDGTVHYGIDIANSIGTPIVSVLAGTVVSAGPASGFGLWVRVQHEGGTITVYGHNDRNVVSVGQRVAAGQQIATIGNRGQSSGPHVHFEVAPGGGRKVDPLVWLRSHGVAI